MKPITLDIPEASPSMNEHKWKHWSQHLKLRRHWSMLVMVAKNQSGIGNPDPYENSTVTITREGYRMLDADNFVGGLKSLIDSLREQRLIKDDDPAHMTLITLQIKIPKTRYPRTLVEIKRL